MEKHHTFLAEAAKTFAAVANVLERLDRMPDRAGPLDVTSFPDAMFALCRQYQRRTVGIDDLRSLTRVFDAIRFQRGATVEELLGAIDASHRVREWLDDEFSDARPKPTLN